MTEQPTATQPNPNDLLGEQPHQEDYWGFESTTKHFLKDKVSFFEIRAMNEGARAKFQRENNQDMKINRRDDSASVRIDAAKERHSLITNSVVGWNLKKGGEVVDFNAHVLKTFLEVADPKIVDELEHACRMANPWLTSDMSIEDIDTEIQRLQEMRDEKVKEDLGNASSSGSAN